MMNDVLFNIFMIQLTGWLGLTVFKGFTKSFWAFTLFMSGLLIWLPFQGFTAAQYLHSVIPHISYGSVFLLTALILSRVFQTGIPEKRLLKLTLSIFVLGSLLVASSFGILGFELYSLGLDARVAWVFIPLIGLLMVLSPYLAYSALLCGFLWLFNLGPTLNLFDYLLDIPLLFWALGYLIYRVIRVIKVLRHS